MSNSLTDFWPKKWPSKKQWKKLPGVLSKKEKIVLLSLVFITVFSFFYTSIAFYYSKTEVVPAKGGVYREGIIESTRFLTINPLYASQSETERDIIEVVFDGLMRHDENGILVPNLAKEYTTEDNVVFDITLREDIYWSDGEKIGVEDILFTVKTIQSPDFQSTLRQQWTGVEVEKISDRQVRFVLDAPSSIFPENLTLKMIPMHIFEDYSPRDFRYSIYNMKPIGSGPYRFKDIKEDSDGNIEYLKLERNPHYFKSEPLLNEVSFHFFKDMNDLLRAQRRGEIDGFTISDSARGEFPFEDVTSFIHHELFLPRYFSVFFNLQSKGVMEKIEVRKALNYATNKEELIEKVLEGKGVEVNDPLLLNFYGIDSSDKEYSYDLKRAKELLEEAGFENGKKETEDPFFFTEDLKKGSQGEEVRNLQRCFISLGENDKDLYPNGEVTGFFDESERNAVSYFQEKYREEILDPHGFKSGTGMVAKSTREKLNELCESIFNETIRLEITLKTLDDPMLIETADILKEQWGALGIKTTVEKKSVLELKEEVIRPRNFELLLFGTMLPGTVNPLPLWHSTKIDDPGLNLSGYENEGADKLMEVLISENGEEREDTLLKLQKMIMEEVPGVFLYNPYFVYSLSEKVQGVKERVLVNSSKRFEDIDKWYINTKRIIKR